jgi:hypothetical protein
MVGGRRLVNQTSIRVKMLLDTWGRTPSSSFGLSYYLAITACLTQGWNLPNFGRVTLDRTIPFLIDFAITRNYGKYIWLRYRHKLSLFSHLPIL